MNPSFTFVSAPKTSAMYPSPQPVHLGELGVSLLDSSRQRARSSSRYFLTFSSGWPTGRGPYKLFLKIHNLHIYIIAQKIIIKKGFDKVGYKYIQNVFYI